jgi:predicted naringenin-chalcone synthase
MFVSALGTATPAQRYTKAQCWHAFEGSVWFDRLDARARAVARSVLQRDNGIDTRHLAVDSLDEVFTIDADTLHQRFIAHAPALALRAAQQALREAQLAPSAIDAIVVSTCTGYLCPGLSGYVVEDLGLRADVLAFDLVGQGCAAALPNWQLAQALIGAGSAEHVLSVCVEVCSAAMYLDNDVGVLISACLFGDGAGAAVLSHRAAPHATRRVRFAHHGSTIDPAQRDALRFETRAGLLRNVLTRAVPQLAARQAYALIRRVTESADVDERAIAGWIVHAGGRDVLLALQEATGLDADALRHSAAMLRAYGNLSSAFVFFVLQAALADRRMPGGWWWMTAFGAGFSCHGALLQVDRSE